jgi:hypothetical protein
MAGRRFPRRSPGTEAIYSALAARRALWFRPRLAPERGVAACSARFRPGRFERTADRLAEATALDLGRPRLGALVPVSSSPRCLAHRSLSMVLFPARIVTVSAGDCPHTSHTKINCSATKNPPSDGCGEAYSVPCMQGERSASGCGVTTVAFKEPPSWHLEPSCLPDDNR